MKEIIAMREARTPRTARQQFDRQAAHYNAQWSAWSEKISLQNGQCLLYNEIKGGCPTGIGG